MIFRNIVLAAILAGFLSGLIYSFFQQQFVSPIIIGAEEFEVAEHEAVDDGHDHQHWGPEDGFERSFFTWLSNVLVAVAFAILLVASMALHDLKSKKPKVNAVRGLMWGAAAMVVLFVAPSMLGMHPEVPGTLAPALEKRQMWWIYCVCATGGGLAVSYYAPLKFKLIGAVLVVLPHLAGVPHAPSLQFANSNPEAVARLTELTDQFYLFTATGMGIFYLSLGAISGYATRRFVDLEGAH